MAAQVENTWIYDYGKIDTLTQIIDFANYEFQDNGEVLLIALSSDGNSLYNRRPTITPYPYLRNYASPDYDVSQRIWEFNFGPDSLIRLETDTSALLPGYPETVSYAPTGISETGEYIHVTYSLSDTIYQYKLTTPYDVSTIVAAGTLSTEDICAVNDIKYHACFSNDGSIVTTYGGGYRADTVFQSDLSTAFDLTTASNTTLIQLDEYIYGLTFNQDGTQLFQLYSSTGTLAVYDLTVPYDLSTQVLPASIVKPLTYRSTSTDVVGLGTYLAFSHNGKYLNVGSTNIDRFSLATPYDASTINTVAIDFTDGYPVETRIVNGKTFRFTGDSIESLKRETNLENITLSFSGYPSEEYALVAVLLSGVDPNLVSRMAYTASTTDTPQVYHAGFPTPGICVNFYTVDNGRMPYIYNSPNNYVDAVQTTNGGAGSVGIAVTRGHETTGTWYSITTDASDQCLTFNYGYNEYVQAFERFVTVTAEISPTMDIIVGIGEDPQVLMKSTSTVIMDGSYTTTGKMLVQADSEFIPHYRPLSVTAFRFQTDELESTSTWLEDLNKNYDISGQVEGDAKALSYKRYYNKFYFKIRYVVKNNDSVAHDLRPYLAINSTDPDRLDGYIAAWNTSWSKQLGGVASPYQGSNIPISAEIYSYSISNVLHNSQYQYDARQLAFPSKDRTQVFFVTSRYVSDFTTQHGVYTHKILVYDKAANGIIATHDMIFNDLANLVWAAQLPPYWVDDPNYYWLQARLTGEGYSANRSTDAITWDLMSLPSVDHYIIATLYYNGKNYALIKDDQSISHMTEVNPLTFELTYVGTLPDDILYGGAVLLVHPSFPDVIIGYYPQAQQGMYREFLTFTISTGVMTYSEENDYDELTGYLVDGQGDMNRYRFGDTSIIFSGLRKESTYWNASYVIVFDMLTLTSHGELAIDGDFPDTSSMCGGKYIPYENHGEFADILGFENCNINGFGKWNSLGSSLNEDAKSLNVHYGEIDSIQSGELQGLIPHAIYPTDIPFERTGGYPAHNTDFLGSYVDRTTDEVVVLYTLLVETPSPAPYTCTVYVYAIRRPYGYRENITQKISSGSYASVNTASLRFSADGDSVATLLPGQEVEVVVPAMNDPFYVSDMDYLDYQNNYLTYYRLKDFDGLISVSNSIPDPMFRWVYGINRNPRGQVTLTSTSTMICAAAIVNGVNMVTNSFFSGDPTRERSAICEIYTSSTFEAVPSELTLEMISHFTDVNTEGYDFNTAGVLSENTVCTILGQTDIVTDGPYIFDRDSFNFDRDPVGAYYGRVHFRWKILNSDSIVKNWKPRLQLSIDQGAWEEFDEFGVKSIPVSMESFHALADTILDNNTITTLGPAYSLSSAETMFSIINGTESHVFIQTSSSLLIDPPMGITLLKYTTLTGVLLSFETINTAADDLDGPYFSRGVSYGRHILSNGDYLGDLFVSMNDEFDSRVLKYDVSANTCVLIPYPVPSGYTQACIKCAQSVKTTGGQIVSMVGNNILGEDPYICHFNEGTGLYEQGVIITLTGYAAGTFRVSAFFAHPTNNIIKMLVFICANTDLYEVDYNPVNKTFTTPVYLANSVTLGLPLDTYPYNWRDTVNTFYQDSVGISVLDSSGIVHLHVISQADPVGSLFYYKNDTFYLYQTYFSTNNVRDSSLDSSEKFWMFDYQRGSLGLPKFDENDDYYSVMAFKGTPNDVNSYALGSTVPYFYNIIRWDDINKRFIIVANHTYGNVNTYKGAIVYYSDGFENLLDVPQVVSEGPYTSVNGGYLLLNKAVENDINIASNNYLEIFASLQVDSDWIDTICDADTLTTRTDTEIRIRLFDEGQVIDDRDIYATIIIAPKKIQEGELLLETTTTAVFKGTRITDSNTVEMYTTSFMTCTAAEEELPLYCEMRTSSFIELDDGYVERLGLFYQGLKCDSSFIAQAVCDFAGKINIQSDSLMLIDTACEFYAEDIFTSSSTVSMKPSRERLASLGILGTSSFGSIPSRSRLSSLPIQTDSEIAFNATIDKHSSVVFEANSQVDFLASSTLSAALECLTNSDFVLTPEKVLRADLNLISTSAFTSFGSTTVLGSLSLRSGSFFGLSTRNELSAKGTFKTDSAFNALLSWNDNRDIILFSSCIERVVEFTLYDNDTNFVQDITTNYLVTWDMSKLNTFDLQINQLQSFDSYIDQVREFELQSVELEPILFTGDITMKIEYDLNIVQEAIYETEISTDIEYNMQIEKISDKVIPIGL